MVPARFCYYLEYGVGMWDRWCSPSFGFCLPLSFNLATRVKELLERSPVNGVIKNPVVDEIFSLVVMLFERNRNIIADAIPFASEFSSQPYSLVLRITEVDGLLASGRYS